MSKILSDKEKANLTRWNGKKRGHYEVYYLKFNDVVASRAYWIRYTMLAPLKTSGDQVCEVWAIAFDAKKPERNYAKKLTLPISTLNFSENGFYFAFACGANFIDKNGCAGKLGEGEKEISWNLKFMPDHLPVFKHFPKEAMYKLPMPKTKVLAPNLSMLISGKVTAFGETKGFDGLPGHQAHIWGTKHAFQWAWANCNTFIGENEQTVFEALSAQIAVGPVKLPYLSMCALRVRNEEFKINSLLDLVRTRSIYDIEHWEMDAENNRFRISMRIANNPKNMVGVTYRDPDGELKICNNTKVATMAIRVQEFRNGLWKTKYEFESIPHTAAYEVVAPESHPDIPVMI
ncbi:MAG: hypothetical protein Kow0090_19230 [Myxococcota bacterium]